MRYRTALLWFGWMAIVGFCVWNGIAAIRGDTAAGPCLGEQSAAAVNVHLEPALFADASWADFDVPPQADRLVVCQDGQAMSYRVLDRESGYVRMRIGNRWVLQHLLEMDLDAYSSPDRWQVLFVSGT